MKFVEPVVEIVNLDSTDVIVTSPCLDYDPQCDWRINP
jgi:hypothetical protein